MGHASMMIARTFARAAHHREDGLRQELGLEPGL